MLSDPLNNRLITANEKGTIYLRDLADGKLSAKYSISSSPIRRLALNSTGKLLLVSTSDGKLQVFDFQKEKVIQQLSDPDYTGMNFCLFSIADGFIYFNAGNRLFKTRSDLLIQPEMVLSETDSILDAVISNDRRSIIYSTGKTLKVMDTRSDHLLEEFSPGNAMIRFLAFVGESTLVSWCDDGTIAFWKYALGQVDIKPFRWFKAGFPFQMNFSADGKWLATGKVGKWARVWNVEEKSFDYELFGHPGTVTACAFGMNETTIFTGDEYGNLIAWKKDSLRQVTEEKVIKKNPEPELPKPALETPKVSPSSIVSPNVIMSEQNIPKVIEGRNVLKTENFNVSDSILLISVFDNSYIDGDTLSLYFNGSWILYHYGVLKMKKEIRLSLKPGTNNFLVLFANNLGKTPPNTAVISFRDGKRDHIVRLSSDLHSCSAVNFIFKQ